MLTDTLSILKINPSDKKQAVGPSSMQERSIKKYKVIRRADLNTEPS